MSALIFVGSASVGSGQFAGPGLPSQQQPSTQSLSFSSSDQWIPGTTVTLDVFLTFTGYDPLGISYWLEVPNSVAPFLSITGEQYFTFHFPNQTFPNPAPFNSTSGARPGYMNETRDLGASELNPKPPSGTYHISTLTLSIAPGMPLQTFTLYSTSTSPRISEVTDNNFNDHAIIPPGQFTVGIIPEPSTFALLCFVIIGASLLLCRRTMPTNRR